MRELLSVLFVLAFFNADILQREFEAWNCDRARLQCMTNQPDVFFGTKEYSYPWTVSSLLSESRN